MKTDTLNTAIAELTIAMNNASTKAAICRAEGRDADEGLAIQRAADLHVAIMCLSNIQNMDNLFMKLSKEIIVHEPEPA